MKQQVQGTPHRRHGRCLVFPAAVAFLFTIQMPVAEGKPVVPSCSIGVLLVSQSVDEAHALASAARKDILVIRYEPITTSLEALAARVRQAVGGAKVKSMGIAVHDTGSGKFCLTGSETVTLDSTLGSEKQQAFWREIGKLMTSDGRIDILACRVAATERGRLLVAALEGISGTNVATSRNNTGNPSAGGDWFLETHGIDAAAVYFDPERLKAYTGLLTSQLEKLEGADAGGAWDGRADDRFGTSVAIDGDYALIGAPGVDYDTSGNGNIDDYTEEDFGQAYLFKRSQDGTNRWSFFKTLRPASIGYHDGFGSGVAINAAEGIAVVGAPYRGTASGEDNPGAYVFRRDEGGVNAWGEECQLSGDSTVTGFGEHVDISSNGQYIIVGARKENIVASPNKNGAAYIFKKGHHTVDADDYGRVKKIEGPTDSDGEQFGQAVSIDGNYAVVGMPLELYRADPSDPWEEPGSIYVYRQDFGGADNWGQIRYIHASDWGDGHNFGCSVSLSGNYLAVGAYGHNSGQGAVYLFKKDTGGGDNWGELKKLTGEHASDRFGHAVDLRGADLLVGAVYGDTGATQTGASYIHRQSQGGADNWGQVEKITPSDGASGDQFGYGVGLSSGYEVLVSSINDNSDAGSAYVFDRDTYWPGPDPYGYTGEASDDAWEGIAGTGTTIVFANPEDGTEQIPIGFSFPFYGTTYTNVYVSVNGFLTFNAPGGLYYINSDFPTSAGVPGSMVAPWWDDLSMVYNTASVYAKYEVKGTAPGRRLIVHWRAEHYNNRNSLPLATVQFQAKLYETTGRIVFVYYDTDADLPNTVDNAQSATIGIQNPAGTQTVRYGYNGSRPMAAGFLNYPALRFTMPYGCPSCSGSAVTLENTVFASGTTCVCTGTASITTGAGVIIEAGANVTLTAPVVTIGPGMHVESGAVFHVNP